MVLDPVVHAALIVIFTYLVNLVLTALGLNLGGEIATQLATVIVGYILSLFGFALYRNIVPGADRGVNASPYVYHPPFS